MFTKKGVIVGKATERFGWQKKKYHDDPVKKRQAVKKRYSDKKESIEHYKKEKYVEHQTSNISHKKAKHHANSERHLLYNKCECHENPEQYAIKVCINAVSDCLSLKNFIFLMQTCIIQ